MVEQEAPKLVDWMRKEVAIGAEQAESGEFRTLSLSEVKAQILADYEHHSS